MTDSELRHYGVVGMKWGVRRYRNKDGTLTDSGRKKMLETARKYESKAGKTVADNHIGKAKRARLIQDAKDLRNEIRRSDLVKAKKAKTNSQPNKEGSSGNKSVKDMSNDELMSAIRRKELENSYSRLYPKQVSAGKKYAETIVKNAVLPAVTNATRNLAQDYITKKGKEVLGMNSKPSKNNLKDEVTQLALRKQKRELEEYFRKLKD